MCAKKAQYGLGEKSPQKTPLRWLYLPFILLLGLGSMVLATQRIAAFFDYQAALGQPWGIVFGLPWYAPWSAFVWQERFGASDTYGFIDQAIVHSQVLFLLAQFVIIGFWLRFQKKLRSNANLHGSARWAEEKEIRTMGYFEGKGVYVGGWLKKYTGLTLLPRMFQGKPDEVQRYLRRNGPEHIMVFAPTRSGKGIGLILPTLLAWEGSSIVLDIKGENWALTAGWRKSQDQLVLRFDPSDPSGASASFNPLEEIRLDTLLAIPDVQNMAAMLVDPTGKGLEEHWSKAAFAMLGGAILHCCIMTRHAQKRTATLYDLSCMLADESRTIQDLFKEMVAAPHADLLKSIFPDGEGGDKAHTFIASSAREMLNKAENEASGVVSTALTNLALYRDPVVALKAPIMDGQIHRVPLIGRNGGELDGAYCGYLDERPAGWMQNFSAGEKTTWAATGHTLTKEQLEAQRAEIARKREERQRLILEQQQKTARDAFTEWIGSDYASNDNPYLQAKGVPAFGLREDIDGTLLVPVMNVDKELRGLQTISPDGEKRFMYGMEKNGNFHMIGDYGLEQPGVTPFDDKGRNLSQGEIILAEGYATGATLHMATEKPVAVAFDAGNLEPVAKKLREKFPNAAITICADNDHKHTRKTPEGTEPWNKGVELAQRAAQEVGGKVAVPIFTDEERDKGLTDFNDLHKSRGLDEVKRQVGLVLRKDVEREKSRSQGLERGMSL